MEALAMLRLPVSPHRHHNFSYVEDDIDEITLPTPYTSAPSSPRRAFSREVLEAPLGEVLAAIPFAWELIPGTPKKEPLHMPSFFFEAEETMQHQSSSSSTSTSSNCTSDTMSTSTTESLSRESSHTDFDFSSRFVDSPPAPVTTAEDLFANGKLIPRLRLPPRLQHLRSADSSVSSSPEVSSRSGFKSFPSPQASTKEPSLCGFSITTDEEEETTVLGMQERKHMPLSPPRFLNREHYFSSDSSSVSSSSSPSSASASEESTIADSQAEKTSGLGSVVKELLFTDMAMAGEQRKPRPVQSKTELLKKAKQEMGDVEKLGGATLTPELSRPSARSRPAPIDTHVNNASSSRKKNVGKAMVSNRLGMLCSCLGIVPDSP